MNDDRAATSAILFPAAFDATETGVRLCLIAQSDSGRAAVEFTGRLEGPTCRFARTLPTTYHLARPAAGSAAALAESFVADPCYWTPALPFLYRLVGEASLSDGSTAPIDRPMGFRRLSTDRGHLRLETQRTVLRGAVAAQLPAQRLDEARDAAAMAIVRDCDDELGDAASRHGVGLIADLREAGGNLDSTMRRLAWHPSVMVAIVDEAANGAGHDAGLLIANVVHGEAESVSTDPRYQPHLVVVELSSGERPPAWIASSRRPVIAIRRGATYADLYEARAACDRLQADLAPQFNLAGYFVAP